MAHPPGLHHCPTLLSSNDFSTPLNEIHFISIFVLSGMQTFFCTQLLTMRLQVTMALFSGKKKRVRDSTRAVREESVDKYNLLTFRSLSCFYVMHRLEHFQSFLSANQSKVSPRCSLGFPECWTSWSYLLLGIELLLPQDTTWPGHGFHRSGPSRLGVQRANHKAAMSLTPLLRTSENHEMEPSDYSKLMSLRTSDPL